MEKLKALLYRIEDSLFWWLDKRWRKRASVAQIERHREWLNLDITVKQKEIQDGAKPGSYY